MQQQRLAHADGLLLGQQDRWMFIRLPDPAWFPAPGAPASCGLDRSFNGQLDRQLRGFLRGWPEYKTRLIPEPASARWKPFRTSQRLFPLAMQ